MDPDRGGPARDLLVVFEVVVRACTARGGPFVRAGLVRGAGVLLGTRLLVLGVERRLGGGRLVEDGPDAPDVGRDVGVVPLTCSGAMYWVVPAPAFVGPGGWAMLRSRILAIPLSETMFEGLRSRWRMPRPCILCGR